MRFPDYNTLFRGALRATDAIPHDFQRVFAESSEPFDVVRAPTGSGKTEAILLGWVYRRFGPDDAVRRATPRRLVYCLPMRTLVEQTRDRAVRYLDNLGLLAGRAEFDPTDPKKLTKYTPTKPTESASDAVAVHLLLGGEADDEWALTPERDAILVGTQDMLLSRALNRGYARSRFQWPIDFGLLNNDCLWVFDELQLMGSGVSTSAQLAGLRDRVTTFGTGRSIWMSATMDRSWLRTVDLRERVDSLNELMLTESELTTGELGRRMTAKKTLHPAGIVSTDKGAAKAVARLVIEQHHRGTLMLVVLNTVNRATEAFDEIKKLVKKLKGEAPEVLLIHSRFRLAERKILNDKLQDKTVPTAGRIIVATQVVEAGVDISARVLVTELAPWPSLVQRFGRCHRNGEPEWDGDIYWLDVDTDKAAPYQADELEEARKYLAALAGKDVSPKALDDFRFDGEPVRLIFEHQHVIRRRDLLDLFDTAPDLSGNDIDVSRFVRGDKEDTDVQVFWRANPPDNNWKAAERRRQAARRIELCNVPIGSFKTEFLGSGKMAYRFDHLDGKWWHVGKKAIGTVVPGQVFWVVAEQGGYDRDLGWLPTADRLPDDMLISLPTTPPLRRTQYPEEFYDSDELSQMEREWKTIAEHTDDVVKRLTTILHPNLRLPVPEELRRVLEVAARWHDWGKAHAVFQSGVRDDPHDEKLPVGQRRRERPEKWKACSVVAKAPDEFWRRYKRIVRLADAPPEVPEKPVTVKRFRHELASALGVLALERDGLFPADWQSLGSAGRLLALYLVVSHHGKVRLSVRTMPDEWPVPPDPNLCRFAAGVWDGDKLPNVDLGDNVSPPEVVLSLDTMQLGGAESWSAGVLRLRDDAEFGPFRLAYLEALLRAADCRASDEAEGDTDD